MITRIPGVLVGHSTDETGATGCTVVLLPAGTTGAYAQVGGAPGTRETDLLRPGNLVAAVNAYVLCGGSAFGLAAADGVATYLEERGVGLAFGDAVVPIVPAAVLFDLGVGDPRARPSAADGYRAAAAAGEEFGEGSVGAGTGATVGKWRGRDRALKSGIGSASRVTDDGLVVGALVANNAAGDVLDESGERLSGAGEGSGEPSGPGEATVLAVVATNARMDKSTGAHVARMATVGIARAVDPAHTLYDGDTVFLAATGTVTADPSRVGALAAEVVAEAVRRSVRLATARGGVAGLAD